MSPVVNRKSTRFWQKILKFSVCVLICSAETGTFADNLVVRTAGTVQDGLFQTVSNSVMVSDPSIILEDAETISGSEAEKNPAADAVRNANAGPAGKNLETDA